MFQKPAFQVQALCIPVYPNSYTQVLYIPTYISYSLNKLLVSPLNNPNILLFKEWKLTLNPKPQILNP